VVVSPGGWIRRQLCEQLPALFQAVATCHLLSASCSCSFIYCSSLLGVVVPTYSCSFLYLVFSLVPVPPLFSSVEFYQPATVAGLVCLEMAWGTALPPLFGGASCMSVTVANLVHSKHLGGRHQTHLLQQALFI
jgi:hypothetical protein